MDQLPPWISSFLNALVDRAPAISAVLVGAIIVKVLLNRSIDLLARNRKLGKEDIALPKKLLNWIWICALFILLIWASGISLGGMWTVLTAVLAMVAIGFVAAWSILSNLSCTVLILVSRPFAIGDEIEIPGDECKGRVIDLNFLYTTLEDEDGSLIQIPNNLFFQRILKRRPGTANVSLGKQLNQEEQTTDQG